MEERLIELSSDEMDCTPLVLEAVCALATDRNLLVGCFLRAEMRILKLKEVKSHPRNANPRAPVVQEPQGVGTASSASGVAGGVEKSHDPGDDGDDVHRRHSFLMWSAPQAVTGIRDCYAVFVPPEAYSLTSAVRQSGVASVSVNKVEVCKWTKEEIKAEKGRCVKTMKKVFAEDLAAGEKRRILNVQLFRMRALRGK
jgi:hypothetical protein